MGRNIYNRVIEGMDDEMIKSLAMERLKDECYQMVKFIWNAALSISCYCIGSDERERKKASFGEDYNSFKNEMKEHGIWKEKFDSYFEKALSDKSYSLSGLFKLVSGDVK